MLGGRFNRPGTACFYTSLRFETAWLEAQQAFAFKAQPMTLCSYRIDSSDILDLTKDEGLAAALISRAELACAWEVLAADRKPVPTWELADRLIKAGCAGIIVPSFAARASEISIWSCGIGRETSRTRSPSSMTKIACRKTAHPGNDCGIQQKLQHPSVFLVGSDTA